MTRATVDHSRYRRRHHPRSILPRARSVARSILETPAWSRADDGAALVSLPVAAAITGAVLLAAAALLELAATLLTGRGL